MCGATLLTAAVLAGCGDSGSDNADPDLAGPTTSATGATSAPTTTAPRPKPSSASHPSPSAIRTSAATPTSAARVPLGRDFRLKEGQSAEIQGTDLVVTFTRLVSDSRCPSNVTCIQAGEATIAIKVTGLDDPQAFELTTPGDAGANEKRLGKFIVQLRAVEPYPTDPGSSGKSDVLMVAVLRVVKQG